MAEFVCRTLACAVLLAPLIALTAEPERSWYQVEVVLFANEYELAQTAEVLTTDDGATQAATAVALGPPWPAPLRPERTTELEMLWNSVDAGPSVTRLGHALDPETEHLVPWLKHRDAGSGPPDLDSNSDSEPLTQDPNAPRAPTPQEVRPEASYQKTSLPVSGEDLAVIPNAATTPSDLVVPLTLAFRTVEADQHLLTREVARLGRAQEFRMLTHLAWRQPFEAGAPAIPIAVRWQDPDTGKLRLAGGISVALRRYLHVEFDLAWLEDRASDVSGKGEEAARWVPIEQSRRMRSGETHYVDHPRVGALVRITPFALAEPLTQDGPPIPAPSD